MMRKSYSEKQLVEALQRSTSIRQVLQKLGLAEAGGNYASVQKQISLLQLNTSHFNGRGWRKGTETPVVKCRSLTEILLEGTSVQSYKLKQRLLLEGIKVAECERCKLKEWQGQPIALELHHINGKSNDNRLENLQILCPNCHAMTLTYRGRNKGKV